MEIYSSSTVIRWADGEYMAQQNTLPVCPDHILVPAWHSSGNIRVYRLYRWMGKPDESRSRATGPVWEYLATFQPVFVSEADMTSIHYKAMEWIVLNKLKGTTNQEEVREHDTINMG